MGGICTCSDTQYNSRAVGAQGISGVLQDIDRAALQAIESGIGTTQASGLKQTLSLSFALRSLPNVDTFSKTDAFIVLYQLKKQPGSQTVKQQIGRTECIYDNLDPDFVTSMRVDYLFEETQNFVLQAFSMKEPAQESNLHAQQFIGEVEFKMHQVVTAADQHIEFELVNPARKKNGRVAITAEEVVEGQQQETATIQIAGNFKNSGQLFFLIWKELSPGKYKPVYKSEFRQKLNGKQEWSPLSIDTTILCNQDPELAMKIDVYKQLNNGNNNLLGSVLTSLGEIKEKPTLQAGQAEIQIVKFSTKPTVNFLDYVFGGCEINLNIAIDFTASNKEPHKKGSLHNLSDLSQNEYLQALKAVGNILQYYDSDKMIPVYGFGARVDPLHQDTSHCFALNGDIFDPECDGLDECEAVYMNAVNKVTFNGPTYFAPIISTINERCEASEVSSRNQNYQILLIITDGIIMDLQSTIDEVVRGSDLPLSIVIVGVGNANFSKMDVLDADTTPLYSHRHKKYMSRDIVQFVPFREFQHDTLTLAKEVLTEIPGQVVDFFQSKNIQPKPAKEEDRQKIARQLSLKSKVSESAVADALLDLYQCGKKEEMIQRAKEDGLDNASHIIENVGLYENKYELLRRIHMNPEYVNPLKLQAD